MTHLHVPDGVLPVWLWVAGWIIAAGLVGFAARAARGRERARRIPLVGVVSALVLVAMSIEVVPIAYHVNLTVIAGVLLGPWLGIISAFVVATILALLGHGGVTVIGLNTVLFAAEVVLGWALFGVLARILGKRRAAWAGGGATVVTLAATTGLLVAIVALAGTPDAMGETAAISLGRFATVVFTLGPIGWALEAAVTAVVLGFVSRVRPDLVFRHAAPRHAAPPGDEGLGH